MAWHHHGSDTPTSARAVLHHTDPNGPNILKGSVHTTYNLIHQIPTTNLESTIS